MLLRVAILLLLALAAQANAQNLPVAGDGEDAWAALSVGDEATLTLWHRAPGDPADRMRRVQQLRGRLMNGGIAASGQALWLVYRDGSVQHVTAQSAGIPGHFGYQASRARELPDGTKLRGLTADAAGPWALVTVNDRIVLAALDAAPDVVTDDTSEMGIALGMPPGLLESEDQPPAEPTEPTPAPVEESAIPVDRLLHLAHGQWRVDPLPEDWPHAARSGAVIDPTRPGRPILLAQSVIDGGRRIVTVYEPAGDSDWTGTTYDLPYRTRWAVAVVAGQLVLAQRVDDAAALELTILRRGSAYALGTVALPAVDTDWTLLPVADAAAVVVAMPGDEPAIGWTRVGLRGELIEEMTPIVADPRAERAKRVQDVMLVAVIVLSLLMLFVFWQRDPRVHRPMLDDSTQIAVVWKRMLAAGIDLLPAAIAVILYFDVTPEELRTLWRLRQIDPIEAAPAMAAIGLFTVYTLVCELIAATTPGKRLCGLRVSSLDGTRPRAWQLIARNGLKAFDLVAPLLLILPLLSPYRQRLGDLVARTLVVEPKIKQDNAQETKE